MKNHTPDASEKGLNRAKPYQLVLFPLNNGATNVYFVLILSYVAQFGSSILHLGIFASLMVTVMRVCDAITDPIIGAMMDRTSTRIGKFRPFMILGSVVMALSVIALYILLPLIPDTMMPLRYVGFTVVYFIWAIPSRPPSPVRGRPSSPTTPTSAPCSPSSTPWAPCWAWASCSSSSPWSRPCMT